MDITITKDDVRIMEEVLRRGNDVELRQRPRTGELLILEVKKQIKNGK